MWKMGTMIPITWGYEYKGDNVFEVLSAALVTKQAPLSR